MNDEPLPAPLVPADVDLRDFGFMPLDVQRLRDSDLAAEETPATCWAALLLWCAGWHQVPAASIPDSDRWQAKHAGYLAHGEIAPAWETVRAGALRGWVLCSDGRLYHPVIAEKAVEAWKAKQAQRARTRAATEAREARRREAQTQRDVERDVNVTTQRDVNVTSSKGQGQGQGQGIEKKGERKRSPAAPPPACPEGVGEQTWSDWLELRRKKRAPVSETAVAEAAKEAEKAGMTLEGFLRVWCMRGSQGLSADWIKPHERAIGAADRTDRQLTTAALMTGAARAIPPARPAQHTIDCDDARLLAP